MTTGEEFFRDLCDHALDLIQCVAPDGRFVYVNEAWLATLGYSRDDLPSLTMFDVIHPDCRATCSSKFRDVLAGNPLESFETVFVSKSGEAIPVEGSASCRFDGGHPVQTRGVFRDIRIRTAAHAEIDKLFSLSPDLICIAGTDGYFKRVNPAFVTLLGYSREELTSKRVIELVHPDDSEQTAEALASHDAGEPASGFENRLRTKDGQWKWLSWRAAAPDDDLIYAIARDITPQKELEREMSLQAEELARSNADLEQLAWVASHDLRAPLRSIGNLAEWIEEDLPDDSPATISDHVTKLRAQVGRMEGLIEDLLGYARAGKSADDIETVDVADVVAELASLLTPSGEFDIVASRTLPTLETARTPLAQVLRNLIANAIAHHDRARGRIVVSALERGDRFEFTVTDDGPGIPEKYRDTVFQMFHKLQPHEKDPGSGIGLALVKKIVETYGGSVWVDPAPRRGATFCFTWPMKPARRLRNAEDSDRR